MTTNTPHIETAPLAGSQDGFFVSLLSQGSRLTRPRRLALYAGIALALLVAIWAPAGLFLLLKPTSFTSTWALILPGAGAGHAVSLDSVGQASATVSSPYNSHSVDPKVNYKAVAESEPVLAAAAASVGMTFEEFGKPRIKLVDQTALMNFRVTGATAEQALAKSKALYDALQAELDRLRGDELLRREVAIGDMLSGFSTKLRDAQQRILDYQSQAQIVSLEQFNELTLSLERRRGQMHDLEARRAGLIGQIEALRRVISTTPETAVALLSLQRDPLFQQLTGDWAAASAQLTKNLARWGEKHQQVVDAREDERELRKALARRARALAPTLAVDDPQRLAQGTSESTLYQRLVELSAERHGLDAELESLRDGIAKQTRLLERGTTDAANLEDLRRRHQVATAVFTTALAKVDIGKSDRFSSYPLVQLLAEPTLPERPDTLGRNLAVLGAAAGSFFVLLGLYLLWIRKPFFQKLLKNA
jgi:uncharacterized protein involved in exopolysaccharide biosynthesis